MEDEVSIREVTSALQLLIDSPELRKSCADVGRLNKRDEANRVSNLESLFVILLQRSFNLDGSDVTTRRGVSLTPRGCRLLPSRNAAPWNGHINRRQDYARVSAILCEVLCALEDLFQCRGHVISRKSMGNAL